MISYKELIKGDVLDVKDTYSVDTDVLKMCWGCEKRHKSGRMVKNETKTRRIFFCEDCFNKLNN